MILLKTFSFKGRASRGTFAASLWVWIGLYLWLCAITVAAHGLGEPLPSPMSILQSASVPAEVATAMMVVLLFTFPVLIIGLVAPSVRRLHDLNLPGILVLVFLALTWFSPYPDQPAWLVLLPPPGTLLWILLMILIPGTAGSNRYGPDPRGDGSPASPEPPSLP